MRIDNIKIGFSKILAILLSILLVNACATVPQDQYASDESSWDGQIAGVHWGWWLFGAVLAGLAISESGDSNDCPKTPYKRDDGITVIGSLCGFSFSP